MHRDELPGPAPARVDPTGLSATTLTVAGVAAVAGVGVGVGWIMQRRSRLAQQVVAESAAVVEQPMPQADGAPVLKVLEVLEVPQPALVADFSSASSFPRAIEPAMEPFLAPEPLPPVEVTFAPVLRGDADLPPEWTLPQELAVALGREVTVIAPLPPQRDAVETEVPRRRPAESSVKLRRFLMKFLLLARTVAGGSSILAAIAIVVFWAIESIDSTTQETQLNLVLLGLALAAWVGAWCCGWIANQLHRSLYNRNHPKFDN